MHPIEDRLDSDMGAWLLGQLRAAFEPPRWAFAFYLRHFLMVAGLSLVPAAQRVVAVLWAERLPTPVNLVLEGMTIAARLLLVVLVARSVFGRPVGPGGSRSAGIAWSRVWGFVRGRWPALIIQMLLLGCLAAAFDFVPERIIAPRVPQALQRAYWAALLALKNPTVIAFTIVWLLVALRQMTLHPERLPPQRNKSD
jgi:hypothetical protein